MIFSITMFAVIIHLNLVLRMSDEVAPVRGVRSVQ